VGRAVDRNSTAELGALKTMAEQHGDPDELWVSFADSVEVAGEPEDVYQFLARAQDWPLRLSHVVSLDLDEEVPDVQHMTMDTRSPDGSVHRTTSVRVCFPNSHIVYKQTGLPALMSAHTGRWTLERYETGVVATSHHTVVLRPSAVAELLGPDATFADARAAVRAALGANSLATLTMAKQFAEARNPQRAEQVA
jgi:aromatase